MEQNLLAWPVKRRSHAKRIVVLGGAGFIGTHLCLRLLADGNEVFCVDVRDAAGSSLLRDVLRHPAFHAVRHNIVHGFGIRCDEIYNLASPSRVCYDKALPVEALQVCMTGTINTLDTARDEHARVLFASSGEMGDTRPAAAEGCGCAHTLMEGKRAAEALHRAYREEFDVDTRIARIYNTYGSGADLMDQRLVMKSVVAALRNRDIRINGSGEQIRTFCWVEDLVEGLVRLMDATPTEGVRTMEFGGGHEVSIRALVEKIVALTGSRSRIVHVKAGRVTPRGGCPTSRRRATNWDDTPHAARRGTATHDRLRRKGALGKGPHGRHVGRDQLKEKRNTMNDFDKIIWSDTLVLVEFFASWCGPCRAMDPTVERFRRMMNGRAEVLRINIDDEQMLPIVRRYRIRTVPTLLLFHRGEERWRRSGITSYEEMVAALEQTEALIHATPH